MPNLILVGHFAGKTVTLNHYRFIKGVLNVNEKDVSSLIAYFRSYSAYLEGSEELRLAQEHYRKETQKKETDNGPVQVLIQPSGDANSGAPTNESTPVEPSVGSGPILPETRSPGVLPPRDDSGSTGETSSTGGMVMGNAMKISDALKRLDPKDDSHWTQQGLPLIHAVEEIMDSNTNILRADIMAAWPGFNRDVATHLAKEKVVTETDPGF